MKRAPHGGVPKNIREQNRALKRLAMLLGVDESRLVPKVEPEDWAAPERWLRRQRWPVVKSGFPW
jgi:hypothetical protein